MTSQGGGHGEQGQWGPQSKAPKGCTPCPASQGGQQMGGHPGVGVGMLPTPPKATLVPSTVPTYLGTARLPVPGRSGSQRRRMAVARPPLQGCVTSLDLPTGDMGGLSGGKSGVPVCVCSPRPPTLTCRRRRCRAGQGGRGESARGVR